MNVLKTLAVVALAAVALPALADDPPAADKPSGGIGSSILNPSAGSNMHSAGQIVGKLAKTADGSLSLKGTQMERRSSGRRGRLQEVEKDVEYTLAGDVKVRWQNLPKKPDGTQYSDKEYKALREPVGTPGYKADSVDLKAGQTVRLYLSKSGKDDKPVVTTVLIIADAPKHDDTSKKKN
jgi:hypothetical protein